MSIKLKWRVQPAPTGKWRSFSKRGWPSAEYDNGQMAITLICDDAYVPAKVKTGDHREITVRIAKYDGQRFTWHNIIKRAKTLEEAKEIAQFAIDNIWSFRPAEYQPKPAQSI